MTKSELITQVDAAILKLAKEYTTKAKYYLLDKDKYFCHNKVLHVVSYFANSTIEASSNDIELMSAVVTKYSSLKL